MPCAVGDVRVRAVFNHGQFNADPSLVFDVHSSSSDAAHHASTRKLAPTKTLTEESRMKINRNPFRVLPGMQRGLSSEVPLPTRLVSNEEFPPMPQTPAQREVEQRILAAAGRLAPRLGLSRRDFLRTSGGMAAAFLAMNAVFGHYFDVAELEAAEPSASKERSGEPY